MNNPSAMSPQITTCATLPGRATAIQRAERRKYASNSLAFSLSGNTNHIFMDWHD
jgi:hypothetical protein